MKSLKFIWPLGLFGFLVTAPEAHATDPSIYLTEAAGSVCQPRAGLGSANYTNFGRIQNEHTTQQLQMDCPVPFMVDRSYGDPLHVYVNLTGNGSNISCTAFVEKLTALPSSPDFFSAFASTSAVGATQLSMSLNVFEGLSDGVLHVFCTLPAKTASGAAEVRGFTVLD